MPDNLVADPIAAMIDTTMLPAQCGIGRNGWEKLNRARAIAKLKPDWWHVSTNPQHDNMRALPWAAMQDDTDIALLILDGIKKCDRSVKDKIRLLTEGYNYAAPWSSLRSQFIAAEQAILSPFMIEDKSDPALEQVLQLMGSVQSWETQRCIQPEINLALRHRPNLSMPVKGHTLPGWAARTGLDMIAVFLIRNYVLPAANLSAREKLTMIKDCVANARDEDTSIRLQTAFIPLAKTLHRQLNNGHAAIARAVWLDSASPRL